MLRAQLKHVPRQEGLDGDNRHSVCGGDNWQVYATYTLMVINPSKYFHVTEGLVMHDLLEGVLPLELKEILKFYINEKHYPDMILM